MAFLQLYSPSQQDWLEIVLPQAGALDVVNDILVASNGDVYLACGESGGALVRLPAAGVSSVEWSHPSDRVFSRAEGPEGTIYAAGVTGTAALCRPMLLRR